MFNIFYFKIALYDNLNSLERYILLNRAMNILQHLLQQLFYITGKSGGLG